MKRVARALVLTAGALAAGACDTARGERVQVIDLLKIASAAERRPVGAAFDLVDQACGAERRPSLAVPAASRMTWPVRLPDRAVFAASVAVEGPPGTSAAFRVGISDERIYEALEARIVGADACSAGWTPIEVDLRPYSGLKFSLFYQPRRITWRIVLGVNPDGGGAARAYWGRPRIESDAAAAQRYLRR